MQQKLSVLQQIHEWLVDYAAQNQTVWTGTVIYCVSHLNHEVVCLFQIFVDCNDQ